MDKLAASNVDRIIDDGSVVQYGQDQYGYGGKIQTRYRIVLKKGGIRRVYMMQYGNAGTPYVIVNGVELAVEHLF